MKENDSYNPFLMSIPAPVLLIDYKSVFSSFWSTPAQVLHCSNQKDSLLLFKIIPKSSHAHLTGVEMPQKCEVGVCVT